MMADMQIKKNRNRRDFERNIASGLHSRVALEYTVY